MLARAFAAFPLFFLACGTPESPPLVIFIGLDGASLDYVDELRSRGELPNFDRLIRTGASGPLQSWASQPVVSENLRRGFWSPIVWTSIATGKVPERHGVRDFVLPLPGTSAVWVGAEDGPASGTLSLPELEGRFPLTLRLRLRSHAPLGEQSVRLLWNDDPVATARVGPDWMVVEAKVSGDDLRPARNRLEVVFSRQHGNRAGQLAWAEVTDAAGRRVFRTEPAFEPERRHGAFHSPSGRMTEVQSAHWRAKPYWSTLGEAGVPVGVVGYWGTWPASQVEGFLVSSRMGIAEHRSGSPRLTWPEDLAAELAPLVPTVEELRPMFERLHLMECTPPLIDQQSVLKKILLQDEFYVRVAREKLPEMSSGVFTVYLRAIDVAGHPTLHWRHGAAVPDGCPDDVGGVVDATYRQIDRWIGEILAAAPVRSTVVVASDHGMRPVEGGGHHAPFGLLIASGEGIRRSSAVHGATVLDVSPTLHYLAGTSVPLDLDGQVIASLFESRWISARLPRYADIDTVLELDEGGGTLTDASEDALEELKALGYIQ